MLAKDQTTDCSRSQYLLAIASPCYSTWLTIQNEFGLSFENNFYGNSLQNVTHSGFVGGYLGLP